MALDEGICYSFNFPRPSFYLFATACRSSQFWVWFFDQLAFLHLPRIPRRKGTSVCLQKLDELDVHDPAVHWDDGCLNCFDLDRRRRLKVFGIRIGQILVCGCEIRYDALIRHGLVAMLVVLVDVLQKEMESVSLIVWNSENV